MCCAQKERFLNIEVRSSRRPTTTEVSAPKLPALMSQERPPVRRTFSRPQPLSLCHHNGHHNVPLCNDFYNTTPNPESRVSGNHGRRRSQPQEIMASSFDVQSAPRLGRGKESPGRAQKDRRGPQRARGRAQSAWTRAVAGTGGWQKARRPRRLDVQWAWFRRTWCWGSDRGNGGISAWKEKAGWTCQAK